MKTLGTFRAAMVIRVQLRKAIPICDLFITTDFFRFMRKHKLFDAWLAGGDGSEFLRETKKASLRAAYASLRMEVPVTGLAWVDGWD